MRQPLHLFSCAVLADIVFADSLVLCHHTGLFVEIVFLAVYRVPAMVSSAAGTEVILLFLELEPAGLHDFGLLGKIVVFALYLFPSGSFGAFLVEVVLFAIDRDETGFELQLIH